MGPAKLLVFWPIAITAAWTDLRSRRVPNPLVLAGLAAGTACAAWGGRQSLFAAAAGLALGSLFLFPAFLLGGVGGGDVKALALIGFFAGPSLLLTAFFWGAVAGGAAALAALLARSLFRRRSAATPASTRPVTLPYAGILFLAAAVVMTLWSATAP